MFGIVNERVQNLADSGMARAQVLAQAPAGKPTADLDAARAADAIGPDQFATLVYTDLSR